MCIRRKKKSLKQRDLEAAYSDGRHARLDFEKDKEKSLMLKAWYEQVSELNNTPELFCEFLKGWDNVDFTEQ